VCLDVVTNRRLVKSLSRIQPGPRLFYCLRVGRNTHVTISGFDYRSYYWKMCHVCRVYSENNLGYSMGLECSTLGVFVWRCWAHRCQNALCRPRDNKITSYLTLKDAISLRDQHLETEMPPVMVSSPSSYFSFFWRNSAQWARASSFTRFLDHTKRRNIVGRTPLDEWSACRTDLSLTTHNTHNR
jgi:hypothetical protein